MGLFGFIKDAGEKLFGGKDAHAAETNSAEELNQKASDAIAAYIQSLNLNVSDIKVAFDSATGKVTINGKAQTQADSEKVTLGAGNVANVVEVENLLVVTTPEPEAQYHDVVKGETLSAIALKYYGNANKYNAIFEANRPMLTHPDKIYPGQKLRIPAL